MQLRLPLISILLLLVASSPALGTSHYARWSTSVGDAGIQRTADSEVDPWGNIYVTGFFIGQVDFGTGVMTSIGNWDVFVAKYAPDGTILWSQTFGSTAADIVQDIDVDGLGFFAITGYTSGGIDLGLGPLTNAGGNDVFLAKYSPGGTPIFTTLYGDASGDIGRAVAIDYQGNVVFAGTYEGTWDGTPSAGLTDMYVASVTHTGGLLWSQEYGASDYQYALSVDTDASGNIVLQAYGYGGVDFGVGVLLPIGNLDIYLVKLTRFGAHVWSQLLGGSSPDYAAKVCVDDADEIVMASYNYASPDFGGGPIPSNGSADVYLSRFDANGNHIWSDGFGGFGFDAVRAMSIGASGDIVIAGNYYGGAIDFGGGPLPAPVADDAYLARFRSDGTHSWSAGFGGPDTDYAYGVAIDAAGNVTMSGQYDVAIDFGDGVHIAQGNDDVYVVRFVQAPAIQSALDIPGDQGGQVNVAWDACSADNTIDQEITEYSVWRAIDAGTATAMIAEGAVLIDDVSVLEGVAADVPVVLAASPSGNLPARSSDPAAAAPWYWYQVASVGALGLANYSAPVPTLYDSTAASPDNHYFQVIAHTINVFVYYTSDPDSGYSVDNLAPAAVQNLAAEQKATPAGLELKWDANSEADLSHYEIYRGAAPGFPAGPGSFLTATPDTASTDTGWQWDSGLYYKVFAVDTHGNKSPYALIGPGLVVGVGDTPPATALDQNVPNPFNPTTTIGFTLIEDAEVTLRIYDAAGRRVRTLAAGYRGAAHYTVVWNGHDDAGREVASGVYFCRLTAGAFTDTRKMVLLK